MATPIRRSERLAVLIPITYRIPGDDHWINSRVLNISESGVLFGPTTLSPGTPVEVMGRLIHHSFYPELWDVRNELTRMNLPE